MPRIAVVTGSNKGLTHHREIIYFQIFKNITFVIIILKGIGYATVKLLASKFDGIVYLTGSEYFFCFYFSLNKK